MRLSDPKRAALEKARRGQLRRVHEPGPGKPRWPAAANTIQALERDELVTRGEVLNRHGWTVEVWTITAAGELALNPPPKVLQDKPLYLQRNVWRGGDYTTERREAIDDLEAVNADGVDAHWGRGARERHHGARDRRGHARQLARHARAA